MIPISIAVPCAILAFLVGLALGVSVSNVFHPRDNFGEALVANAIDLGFPRPHVLLNNVTLETGQGTTQIDHVLVADTGIFVIETKHYTGWIFGRAQESEWTQVIYRKKSRFRNPIHQNYAHVKALQALLSLSPGNFVPLVVFTGDAEFKSNLGPSVIKLRELTSFLSAERPIVFDNRTMASLVGRIEMTRLRRSLETDEYHLNSVRQRIRHFKT